MKYIDQMETRKLINKKKVGEKSEWITTGQKKQWSVILAVVIETSTTFVTTGQ